MVYDDLKLFVKDGESLLFDVPELHQLRSELKKAKTWKLRVDKLSDKLLQTNDVEINELITEASTICVDLSESLQVD